VIVANVARCKWKGGDPFLAEYVQTLPDGSMTMRAREKGPRFVVGTRLRIEPGEVLEWTEGGPPPAPPADDDPPATPPAAA